MVSRRQACPTCGDVFRVKHGNQIYCSEVCGLAKKRRTELRNRYGG